MSQKDVKSVRCKAHLRDGSGRQCNKQAILGGVVCASHGGSAPQVKRSARQRLQALVDPSIDRLERVIVHSDDENVAVRASLGLLDRAGYHPTKAVELTGKDGQPIETAQVDDRSKIPDWWDKLDLETKRNLLHAMDKSKLVDGRIKGKEVEDKNKIKTENIETEAEVETSRDRKGRDRRVETEEINKNKPKHLLSNKTSKGVVKP